MTTILRKTPEGNNPKKELTKVESPGESLGLTLSLSHTSNSRDEVSWSSSDGSTYYSEDEQSLQRRQKQKQQTHHVSHPKQDKIVISAPKQKKNVVSTSVRRNDLRTGNQQSKSSVAKEVKPKKGTNKRPVTKAPKTKKKLILKNVENFPAVNLATGNEDLSQMDLLTSADTAGVFCTNGIPFIVMANKKLYEKISDMSSASAYETDDSCYSECDSESFSESDSESDSESNDEENEELNTERATMRDEISDADSDKASVSEHSVTVVSVSNASSVSSLECASLDTLSVDSDTKEERNSTEEKVRHYQTRKTSLRAGRKRLSQQTNFTSTRQSLEIDSKVERIKERKKKQSDTEEKIKLLKAKIKNIQDLSNATNSYSEGEIGHLSPLPSRTEAEKIVEHEDEDDKSDASESLMERRGARELLQSNKSVPNKTAQTSPFDPCSVSDSSWGYRQDI
jgi:hypothetical protein